MVWQKNSWQTFSDSFLVFLLSFSPLSPSWNRLNTWHKLHNSNIIKQKNFLLLNYINSHCQVLYLLAGIIRIPFRYSGFLVSFKWLKIADATISSVCLLSSIMSVWLIVSKSSQSRSFAASTSVTRMV
jgi:hypothetical protein